MIYSLIAASVQATLKVALIAYAGHFLAKKKLLSSALQRGLSKLSLNFFTPCLLFASTALSLDHETLSLLLPLPIYLVLFCLSAWIVSRIGAKALKATPAQTSFITAVNMFSNTNSLPIAIVQSLLASSAFDYVKRGPQDTREDAIDRGIGYVVFFAMAGNMIRWSYGMSLLRHREEDDQASSSTMNSSNSSTDSVESDSGVLSINMRKKLLRKKSLPVPTESTRLLFATELTESPAFMSVNDDEVEQVENISKPLSNRRHVSLNAVDSRQVNRRRSSSRHTPKQPWWKTLMTTVLQVLNQFSSPPFVAALCGLLVVLIPPLRHLLVDPDAFLHRTLMSAISTCGEAAVPLTLVCLGAQLSEVSNMNSASKIRTLEESGVSEDPTELIKEDRIVYFTTFCRLIFLPALAVLTVWCTSGILHTAEDPVFVMTLMLLGTCPSAINLMMVCQAEGNFERPMGKTILWQYFGNTFTLAFWAVTVLTLVCWGSVDA